MVFQWQGIAFFLAFLLLFSNNVSADSTGDWRLSIEGNMFSVDNKYPRLGGVRAIWWWT